MNKTHSLMGQLRYMHSSTFHTVIVVHLDPAVCNTIRKHISVLRNHDVNFIIEKNRIHRFKKSSESTREKVNIENKTHFPLDVAVAGLAAIERLG